MSVYDAAFDGQLEEVKRLIQTGGNVDEADKNGATPLFFASAKGHLDVVKYLIGAGANIEAVNKDGTTPLYIASYNGHLPVVKYLVHLGASLNMATCTVRDAAVDKNHIDIVSFIDDWLNKPVSERTRIIASTKQIPHTHTADDDDEKATTTNNNTAPYDIYSYIKPDGTELQPPPAASFEPGKIYKFDDGTEFLGIGVIGSGNSTTAYQITMRTVPKVMKDIQNDQSQAHLVATTADLAIHACFPFGGESRRQDYDRYCVAKRLVDPDPQTLDRWLQYVEETFSSWETKTINQRPFSLGASFDAEDQTYNAYRDMLRFCYFYYLLQEKGLVHCDVAPRNVIITWEGPVLIDFGCTVKVDAMNANALPRDVTPAYYSKKRGRIRPNHDVKGFYVTACAHFGLQMDETLLAQLDQRNHLTVDDVILNVIRQ